MCAIRLLLQILGVTKGSEEAEGDQLRKAYHKAALKWHPDRHSSGACNYSIHTQSF